LFLACSQLALKNDFKELQAFWTFFHNDLTLRSAAARIFAGAKKEFCHFKCYYLAIYKAEISEFFFKSSQTSVLQDPTVICVKKVIFQKFGTCTRNGSFGAFLVRT